MVIENDWDFNDLLKDIYANVFSGNNEQYIPKVDNIDFEKYIVIGIFYGTYYDSGVRTNIDKIVQKGEKLIVKVIEVMLEKIV